MSVDPNRFVIGAGRLRPAHQPQEIGCPQCGASIELRDERGQVMVCRYCRGTIELSGQEARAIGAVGDTPYGFALEIGSPFEHLGVRYEVVGRTLRHDLGEPDSQTFGYYLYNPRYPSLWLSCYDGGWELGRRTRVMPMQDVWYMSVGDTVGTYDGGHWRLEEHANSVLAYVDGALPWLTNVGDQSRTAELTAADGGPQLFEVEQNPSGEIEQSYAQRLTPAEIEAATGGQIKAEAAVDQQALDRWGKRPRIRAVGIVLSLFGLLCIATALFLSFGGKRIARATLPPKGGQVGPIRVKSRNTVLAIKVEQQFHKNGWSYLEAELLDQDENYLFGFGDEMWAESGYDEGHWHEEDNDYDLYVTIPERGTYYLAFTGQVGTQGSAIATKVPDQVVWDFRVTVDRKSASTLPFWMAGIFGLLCGILMWEIATGVLRKAAAEAEWD